MESWMVSIGIAVAGVIGTYAVLRNRVERLENDQKTHLIDAAAKATDLNRKLDTQFKRIDCITERTTVLERDTSNHLDLVKAEAKFVSKRELDLHLKNIELTAKNTNKTVEKMEGKLEELISILSKGK